LAAYDVTLDDEDREPLGGRVDGRGEPRRASTDHRDVVDRLRRKRRGDAEPHACLFVRWTAKESTARAKEDRKVTFYGV
jgi:hypothetical protein